MNLSSRSLKMKRRRTAQIVALNTDLEIAPISPVNFTEGRLKLQNLAFEALCFRIGATYHIRKTNLYRVCSLVEALRGSVIVPNLV